MIALLPCPFCGGEPHTEREGTARVSMIIVCDDCGCTLESSDVSGFPPEHLRWNRRFNPMLDIVCQDSKNVRQQRNELREALQALLDARSQTATVVLAAQQKAYKVLKSLEG